MSYGVTAQGFVRKTYEDALGELEDLARTSEYFGPSVDLSTASEVGQFVQLMAKVVADTWEDLEDLYYANNIDNADGVNLDRAVALGGLTRQDAIKATVDIVASGTNGTTLDAGDILAQTVQGVQFENIVTGTVVSGVVTVTCRALIGGEDGVVPANSIVQLVQPVAGITGINNPLASSGGEEIETDPNLRARFKSRGTAGGSSLPAIIAALRNVDNVTRATVTENATNVTDAEGNPPHSIKCVVAGTATDTDIAEAIFNSKSGGIEPVGTSSKVVLDANGDSHTMKWSVPTQVLINVIVEVTSNSDWVTSNITVIKTRVVEAIGGVDTIDGTTTEYDGLEIGADVFSWAVETNFDDIVGMDDIVVYIAEAPATPTTGRKITIDSDEFARCDTANVTVNVS